MRDFDAGHYDDLTAIPATLVPPELLSALFLR